jgi:hypothetical protein
MGGSARLVERQNWFASAGEAVAAGLMARRQKERRGYLEETVEAG